MAQALVMWLPTPRPGLKGLDCGRQPQPSSTVVLAEAKAAATTDLTSLG